MPFAFKLANKRTTTVTFARSRTPLTCTGADHGVLVITGRIWEWTVLRRYQRKIYLHKFFWLRTRPGQCTPTSCPTASTVKRKLKLIIRQADKSNSISQHSRSGQFKHGNIIAPSLRRVVFLMWNYLHNIKILFCSYNWSCGKVMSSQSKIEQCDWIITEVHFHPLKLKAPMFSAYKNKRECNDVENISKAIWLCNDAIYHQ